MVVRGCRWVAQHGQRQIVCSWLSSSVLQYLQSVSGSADMLALTHLIWVWSPPER